MDVVLSFGRGIELERQGAYCLLPQMCCARAPVGGLSLCVGFLGMGSKQRVQKL